MKICQTKWKMHRTESFWKDFQIQKNDAIKYLVFFVSQGSSSGSTSEDFCAKRFQYYAANMPLGHYTATQRVTLREIWLAKQTRANDLMVKLEQTFFNTNLISYWKWNKMSEVDMEDTFQLCRSPPSSAAAVVVLDVESQTGLSKYSEGGA